MADGELVVAMVQRPPIYLDLAASTTLVIVEIHRLPADGAALVVFPETWLPVSGLGRRGV